MRGDRCSDQSAQSLLRSACSWLLCRESPPMSWRRFAPGLLWGQEGRRFDDGQTADRDGLPGWRITSGGAGFLLETFPISVRWYDLPYHRKLTGGTMLRHLILAATILHVPISRAWAQEVAVTLADALRRAERVQPDVIRAASAVRTAEAQRKTAWGAFLPTLSASSSASDFFSEGAVRVDPVTGQLAGGNTTNRSISTSLSANVDLFTGFRRGAEIRAARASENAADASLIDARFQQALTTTNQFLDALAAGQLLRVRQASVRRAEEQLNTSVARLKAGSATRSDSLRSLVTLGNARLDLVTTEALLAGAEATLARLIGQSGRVHAMDDSAFYRVQTVIDTQALRIEAESKSPRVQSALANAAAARSSVSASRSAYWPTLALSGTTNWSGSQSNDYDFLNQSQVSLGFRWNLFDR